MKTEIHFGFNPDVCLAISKRGVILADENVPESGAIQKALGYELIRFPSAQKTREMNPGLKAWDCVG